MTDRPRKMRLTEQLVAQVPPFIGGPNSAQPVITYPTAAEYDVWVQRIVAGAPTAGDVWLFGYGSLIWNPACDFVEERIGTVAGWRRSFCLGWTTVYRASIDRPGLMLALDQLIKQARLERAGK